jgi:uncharacterized protein (UPF0264 family)
MTELLVSVTDAAEALEAFENGAALIDVKDPRAGSLGAASAQTWTEVITAINQQAPVSAALGELLDDGVQARARATNGLAFAKVGLAGCAAHSDWAGLWHAWQAALPPETQPVAVSYVDWQTCGAPAPGEIVQRLVSRGPCRIILFDTSNKGRGTLLDHCPLAALRDLCAALRGMDCRIVLAGSLRLQDVSALSQLEPDYLAVRGAVCRGERTDRLDGALVRQWADALAQYAR